MKSIADPRLNLLTVLNVQSAKPSKRTAPASRDWHALARKAAKRSNAPTASTTTGRLRAELAEQIVTAADHELKGPAAKKGKGSAESSSASAGAKTSADQAQDEQNESVADSDDEGETAGTTQDPFIRHFGAESTLVHGHEAEALAGDRANWAKGKAVVPALGEVLWTRPRDTAVEGAGTLETEAAQKIYNPKLLDKLRHGEASLPTTQSDWLRTLGSYQDVLDTALRVGTDEHGAVREAVALHAMNHVAKTRARVLKNNEFLAKQALDSSSSASTSRDTRDQSFTRPKVLILTPFRNAALAWVQDLVTYLPPSTTLVENYPRFVSEYSLPEGAEDKLVTNADSYPEDHVATFAGNIDDAFRCGIKVTRKSAKIFAEFYQADVIVASPLGLRTSIEKDGDSDFLSSIEMLVVDQMDVMLMQNWEHVQFVMDLLNKMPEEDHGCDFSRVKPWYLDGKAAHLRQSLLFSSLDAPEIRALFNRSCVNRAGKLRAVRHLEGVLDRVPQGLKQIWNRFDTHDLHDEDDKRFDFFTTKTLPTLLKSAVSSSETLIFVPSYFDFVRVKRYLTKNLSSLGSDFSFAAISEYSDTPEISRARGAFYQGKKKFLLVTERFHFFRRYRLRGAKTFVFYAPPIHPHYYPEVLSFPYRPPSSANLPLFDSDELDGDVDVSELSAHVLFSRFDLLRLEGIVGEKDARRMCGVGEHEERGDKRFTFV
ncbi:hypothetical protein JCM8115_006856 [Rhodotorula mucilaginosa]|uniref:U3 small nucleolar RNA-associated protein 25 n=1 Tax=Rhodotorula mucilaginosa TaxID=5537 RepID=A0A9P6W1Y7_RHOMI|nr:rRNA-binding ribosome biosynthesis protein utp25 [Rhodotorula mucilaginosa]